MKNPLRKQIIAGAVALSLIVGGGGVLMVSKQAAAADPPADSTADALKQNHHFFGFLFKGVSEEFIAFLKLDKAAFKEKLKNGDTIAKIAADQGISRDALKAELTKEVNAELEKAKTDFLGNIDNVIDSANIGKLGRHGKPGGPGGHGKLGGPGERGGRNHHGKFGEAPPVGTEAPAAQPSN